MSKHDTTRGLVPPATASAPGRADARTYDKPEGFQRAILIPATGEMIWTNTPAGKGMTFAELEKKSAQAWAELYSRLDRDGISDEPQTIETLVASDQCDVDGHQCLVDRSLWPNFLAALQDVERRYRADAQDKPEPGLATGETPTKNHADEGRRKAH